MSVDFGLFHDWPDDPVTDGRVRYLEQALESFGPKEVVHIAAALLANAHRVSRIRHASYAINGVVVTVEDVHVA